MDTESIITTVCSIFKNTPTHLDDGLGPVEEIHSVHNRWVCSLSINGQLTVGGLIGLNIPSARTYDFEQIF